MREESQGYPDHARAHASTDGIDLDGAIDAFMLSRRVGNATRQTLAYYTTCLTRVARLVSFSLKPPNSGMDMRIVPPPSAPLAAVTPTVIEQYLDSMRRQRHLIVLRDGTEVEKGLSASTLHKHYRVLKALLRWAEDAGLVTRSPLRVRMKTPRTLPRAPDDHAIELLFQHAGTGVHGARNRLLISLFLDCGLRLTELLRVRLSDIDYGTRTVRITGLQYARLTKTDVLRKYQRSSPLDRLTRH